MEIRSTFHALVFFMALLTFSLPFLTPAQEQTVVTQAIADAKKDAIANVNGAFWFATGCLLCLSPICMGAILFGTSLDRYLSDTNCSGLSLIFVPIIGIVGTYSYRPDPPASRLIGKPPEYVIAYTAAYKSEKGKLQAQWAAVGFCTGFTIPQTLIIGCANLGCLFSQ